MNSQRVVNRWIIALAGLAIQINLGVLLAWSIFRPVFERELGWTSVETGLPYQTSLLFYAAGMLIAGRIQDRIGPSRVAVAGGLMLALGTALTGLVSHSVVGVMLTYGMLGGLGVGFAYVTPLATLIKWFPDKRGFIGGLAVCGFGFATVIFAPAIGALLGSLGIASTFYVLACLFLVLVCGCGFVLRVPPEGWTPKGCTVPAQVTAAEQHASPLGRTVRTWQFWALWLTFFLGAGVGLMTIGRAKGLGLETALASEAVATLGVMLLGLLNAVGRLFWGFISDRVGRRPTLTVIFAGYLIAFLLLLPWEQNVVTWLVGISLVGLCYGGFLAVMPCITADFYGSRFLGANYGALFTAYGVGGVLWPKLMDQMNAVSGGYSTVWYLAAAGCATGLAITALMRPPRLPVGRPVTQEVG